MPTAEPLALTLKPKEEDRLLAGHAWVFSNELQRVPTDAEPGTLATLASAQGRMLGLGYFNPRSLIAFRLLSRQPVEIGAEFFRERLAAALELRRRAVPGEDSFRLCFGESDGLPGLVVDKYADRVVLQALSAGIDTRLDLVVGALKELLAPKAALCRNDHPARVLEGLPTEDKVLFGELPDAVEIREAGLRLRVSLRRGQKSGFFFDQRENRAFLAPYCKGKTVFDLHSYVGAFALAAARAGAAKVYALDSSEPAVELARENARLNTLERVCQFDAGDAEEVLEGLAGAPKSARPDVIILDPPSLVPSKKHLPKALRAYARLNGRALRALRRGGLLATSTCSNHVTREEFVRMLRAAAAKVERSARLVALRGQAQDHPVLLAMPETEYLHFALLEVL